MKVSRNRTTLFASILFSIFLGLIACSDDPLSPQNENTDNAIISETIGASGGNVETEKISVQIPAGAFEQNNTISIYEHQDEDTFGENGNSQVMEIRGLPEAIRLPLTIKIKSDETIDENSYLAFGRLSVNESILDSALVYDLYPARDSSGYLVGELPATPQTDLYKLNKTHFHISDPATWLVKSVIQAQVKTTEHFDIYYPISLSDKVNILAQELEKVHDLFEQDLGLAFNLNNERWKVWIKIQQSTIESYFVNNVPLLNISRDKLHARDFESIRLALGAEFIHFYARQHLPDDIKNDIAKHYWLEAAVSAWLQEFLTDNTSYSQPAGFAGNEMAPFNGLRLGAGTQLDIDKIKNHGLGMASLIKYLTENEKTGLSIISQIYEKIKEGFDPAAAVYLLAEEKLGEHWWAEYLHSLIKGDIYGMEFDHFVNLPQGIMNYNASGPVTKTFSSTNAAIGPYPDISAKIFRVDLSTSEIGPSYRMLLSAAGPVDNSQLALMVYAIKGASYEYLGTAHEQDVNIPDLKQYYDNGYHQYLVVVINTNAITSFLGETNIDLTIDIGPAGGNGNELTYNRCVVAAHFYGTYESNRNGPVQTYTKYNDFGSTEIEGGFIGNTFSGIYKNQYGITETVTVTLNDEHNMVTSVSWVKDYKYDDIKLYETLGFNAVNIPVHPDYDSKFEIRGSDCIENLTVYDNWSSGEEDSYIILKDYYCDENGLIYISFSEE